MPVCCPFIFVLLWGPRLSGRDDVGCCIVHCIPSPSSFFALLWRVCLSGSDIAYGVNMSVILAPNVTVLQTELVWSMISLSMM